MGLWGLMVWQFLGDDEKPEHQQMRWVNKQVVSVHRRDANLDDDLPDIEQDDAIPAEKLFTQKPPDDLTSQPEATVRGADTGAKLARIPAAGSGAMPRSITPTPGFRGIAPENMRRNDTEPAERTQPLPPRPPPSQEEDSAPPKGFTKTQTRHFNIYAAGRPPSV